MIVRISGEGQFEVPEGHVSELNRLDDDLTKAVDAGDDDATAASAPAPAEAPVEEERR